MDILEAIRTMAGDIYLELECDNCDNTLTAAEAEDSTNRETMAISALKVGWGVVENLITDDDILCPTCYAEWKESNETEASESR